ncbi:hypothetical protein SCRM01_071c [Synechococcus phage S-CRM01]|uniref:hypothetical protein n=1 Tax=Synechococcus phage S-CRM01 TaxID=1026955 RepID=UPI000209E383|nr:hypothetical protein SCRM01_071c [Synechococcus phage S-CRM01]AEC53017.1 hypothetical protein SCRM01_071c [Synechococcus phage S-CRM01]
MGSFIVGIFVTLVIGIPIAGVIANRSFDEGMIQCKLKPEICDMQFIKYQTELKIKNLQNNS